MSLRETKKKVVGGIVDRSMGVPVTLPSLALMGARAIFSHFVPDSQQMLDTFYRSRVRMLANAI